MEKKTLLIVILYFGTFQFAHSQSIIPIPSEMSVKGKGEIILSNSTEIHCDRILKNSAAFFNDYCSIVYGVKLSTAPNQMKKRSGKSIALRYSNKYKQDSYSLMINGSGISVEGSESGVFYGIQTLIQLLPDSLAGNRLALPYISIKDEPRFAYRGLMLDVSRHFFSV